MTLYFINPEDAGNPDATPEIDVWCGVSGLWHSNHVDNEGTCFACDRAVWPDGCSMKEDALTAAREALSEEETPE